MLSELVRPSIDYVRHKRFRSGNYPSSLSNETDRLVHWCHGAPGVVHMLIMAHKVCVCVCVVLMTNVLTSIVKHEQLGPSKRAPQLQMLFF